MALSNLIGAGALREAQAVLSGLSQRPGAAPRPLRADRHSDKAFNTVLQKLQSTTGAKVSAYDRKLLRGIIESTRKAINTGNQLNTGARGSVNPGRVDRLPGARGERRGTLQATVIVIERNTATGDTRRRPPSTIGGLSTASEQEIMGRISQADSTANPNVVAPPPPTYRGGTRGGAPVGRWEVSDIQVSSVFAE